MVSYINKHFFTPRSHSHIKTVVSFLKKLIIFPLYILVSILTNTKIGRSLIFNSLPLGNLLISNNSDGLKYIVSTSDKSIGLYTYRNNLSYEYNKIDIVFKLLKNRKIDLFVDIGANIGSVGIYVVYKNLASKCISIEPDQNNYFLLQQNVSINNLTNSFKLYNYAISNSDDKHMKMLRDKFVHGDHRIIDNFEDSIDNELNEIVEVKSSKLDDLITYEDNMLLWIDTQGFEFNVINSGENLLKNTPPLITEFCPELLSISNSLEAFINFMSESHYTNFVVLEKDFTVNECNKLNLEALAIKLGKKGQHCDILFT